jgi:hypothetical protein
MAMTSRSAGMDYSIPAPRAHEALPVQGADQLLSRELDELHAYGRTNFRLIVQWCVSFFFLDWLALAYVLGPGKRFVLPITIFFVIQCGMAACISEAGRRYFLQVARRVDEITRHQQQRFHVDVQSPMPGAKYAFVCSMISACLAVNVCVWIWALLLPSR